MAFIEKDLLIGRVQYLEKINTKPGMPPINEGIVNKVVELIQDDQLLTFMQVEAVFNHLLEETNSFPDKIEDSARDILQFLG